MDIQEYLKLDRIQTDRAPDGQRTKAADPETFQRLLEELQALADKGDAPDPARADKKDGLANFGEALRRADDDFATLMDLRHKLEEAFRKQMP